MDEMRFIIIFWFIKFFNFLFFFFLFVLSKPTHHSVSIWVVVFIIIFSVFSHNINWWVIHIENMLLMELRLCEKSIDDGDSFHDRWWKFCIRIFHFSNISKHSFISAFCSCRVELIVSLIHGPTNAATVDIRCLSVSF